MFNCPSKQSAIVEEEKTRDASVDSHEERKGDREKETQDRFAVPIKDKK